MSKTKTKRKYIKKTKVKSKIKSKIKTKESIVHKSLFNNITIGKELGRGNYGTTYLATDNNNNNNNKKKYAYKIEKILPKDVKQTLKSSYWREIDFAKKCAHLYPNQFMYLYDSKIDNDCKHIQNTDSTITLLDIEKQFEASKFCGIKLWSLIDNTFENEFNKKIVSNTINPSHYYNYIIQLVNIVYLMRKHGYNHNDFHAGNIGVRHTKEKYIKILDSKIETYGYLLQAIDYGLVIHSKYTLSRIEKKTLKDDNDLIFILHRFCVDWTNFQKTYYNNTDIWNWQWWRDNFNEFSISDDDKKTLTQLLPQDIKLKTETENFILKILYMVIFYEKWQRQILSFKGIKFKKAIAPRMLIPMNVFLYLVLHLYKHEKVLKYMIENK